MICENFKREYLVNKINGFIIYSNKQIIDITFNSFYLMITDNNFRGCSKNSSQSKEKQIKT